MIKIIVLKKNKKVNAIFKIAMFELDLKGLFDFLLIIKEVL